MHLFFERASLFLTSVNKKIYGFGGYFRINLKVKLKQNGKNAKFQ